MTINFRDFGKHDLVGGGRVVKDRLYRSGHLGGLDDTGLAQIEAKDFAVVVDLRYPEERAKDRSPWRADQYGRVVAHDQATTAAAPHLAIVEATQLGRNGIDAAYVRFYSALPYDDAYRPLFAEAVQRIAATPGRVLIHCTAGKDRTGTFVALLLALLGVADDAIITDYLRSNDAPGMGRLRDQVRDHLRAPDGRALDSATIDMLIRVEAQYVRAGLAAVRDQSGSITGYFRESGVSDAALAELHSNFIRSDSLTDSKPASNFWV